MFPFLPAIPIRAPRKPDRTRRAFFLLALRCGQRTHRRQLSRAVSSIKRPHLPLLLERNPNTGANCPAEKTLLEKEWRQVGQFELDLEIKRIVAAECGDQRVEQSLPFRENMLSGDRPHVFEEAGPRSEYLSGLLPRGLGGPGIWAGTVFLLVRWFLLQTKRFAGQALHFRERESGVRCLPVRIGIPGPLLVGFGQGNLSPDD